MVAEEAWRALPRSVAAQLVRWIERPPGVTHVTIRVWAACALSSPTRMPPFRAFGSPGQALRGAGSRLSVVGCSAASRPLVDSSRHERHWHGYGTRQGTCGVPCKLLVAPGLFGGRDLASATTNA